MGGRVKREMLDLTPKPLACAVLYALAEMEFGRIARRAFLNVSARHGLALSWS
jgi:hypothetical protein